MFDEREKAFLMNIVKPFVQQHKVGSCPHGLPAGACPICSGMGGGGGGSAKKTDRPKGEMSWGECYAIWQQMLKAKDLAAQKKNDALQAQMQTPVNFSAKLANAALKIAALAERLTSFVQKTQSTSTIMSKTLAFAAKLAIPVLNVLQNVAILTQKTLNFIKEKFTDISDKLNAIFGELKNSIEKKISDRLKDFKKRFKSLFGVVEPEDLDEETGGIEVWKDRGIANLNSHTSIHPYIRPSENLSINKKEPHGSNHPN